LLTLSQGRRRIVVINKTDLPSRIERAEVAAHASVVFLSAKTGEGLKDLRDAIRTTCLRADLDPGDGPMVTRLRHQTSLVRAQESMAQALESVQQGLSGEFIALDVRGALDALGEITGAVTTDDILDRIFKEFCIGK
jgi:tRNA modification GTPase